MHNLHIKLRRKISCLLLPVMVLFTFSNIYAQAGYRHNDKRQFKTVISSIHSARPEISINENPFKYNGYYYDSESGLYYLNARYYSSILMRFINRDTYDLANRYRYCDGDPVDNMDTDGHSAWNWVMAGLAISGGIASIVFSGGSSLAGISGCTGSILGIVSGVTQITAMATNGKASKDWHTVSNITGTLGIIADIAGGAACRAAHAARRISDYAIEMTPVVDEGAPANISYAVRRNAERMGTLVGSGERIAPDGIYISTTGSIGAPFAGHSAIYVGRTKYEGLFEMFKDISQRTIHYTCMQPVQALDGMSPLFEGTYFKIMEHGASTDELMRLADRGALYQLRPEYSVDRVRDALNIEILSLQQSEGRLSYGLDFNCHVFVNNVLRHLLAES